jgi:putative zinc finger/helix-turn-helix YgiT family protein
MHDALNATNETGMDAAICPSCKKPSLAEAIETRTFHPRKKEVVVATACMVCDACGVRTVTSAQHDKNLLLLADRKAHYDMLPMTEEYIAFRKRYGLTIPATAKLFALGEATYARYENEKSYPRHAACMLMVLAMRNLYVVEYLAAESGVVVPLLRERKEDEENEKAAPAALLHIEESCLGENLL